MNESEEQVLEAIDVEGLAEAVCALVAIESLGGYETPAQEHVAELMAASGLEVDTWEIDLDALGRHPAYSAEIERDHALGVVGATGGSTQDGPDADP